MAYKRPSVKKKVKKPNVVTMPNVRIRKEVEEIKRKHGLKKKYQM